jgi:undecaprenyl-phosphate 4-deoxy-4-formamido-L-arabinose transferase
MIQYSFVIPTFNNSRDLPSICEDIALVFQDFSYEIILVDDGSTDNTWEIIHSLSQNVQTITALRLSMNFGQHPATLCGIQFSKGQHIITQDDDKEIHPSEAMKMIEQQKISGAAVVYGTFPSLDSFLIRSMKTLYRIVSRLNGKNRGQGSSFRLIDGQLARKIVSGNHQFSFIDELILWYTNSIDFVPIKRSDNQSTISRYKLPGLILTTINIMLFSSAIPLRLVTFFGFLLALINFIFGGIILFKKYIGKIEVDGYASLIVSILFSTGMIITCIGINAMYLRHLLLKTNQKPLFHVAEKSC